ncbi:MAG: putative flavin-binding monooxygenase involved in arsenic resistance, partial [Pedosphaera sp.]|nr:putative flavin-binding monooxygenase involved in arsenic resistance [Pedosphaera sp.]
MGNSRSLHAIIIGAGPAGLGVAVCLAKRGVPFTLLERGTAALAGLLQVDPEMILLSPTCLSRMPDMEVRNGSPNYLSFRQMVDELQSYQQEHKIEVVTEAEVMGVEQSGNDFVVRYKDATGGERVVNGSHVINAAGQISAPRLPDEFEPGRCSFRWQHSIATRARDLQESRRLLVVGGGPSAAEVLENWLEVRRADDGAWISLRSPLVAIPHWILGVDIHYLGWLVEQIPTRILGGRRLRIREPMLGRKIPRAIQKGLITAVPAARQFEGNQVTLTDGKKLEPDLVVFATGFRYTAKHLGELVEYGATGQPMVRACESRRVPRLYLLGL